MKLEANEEFDAIGDAPGFLVGDFNIDPGHSAIITEQINSGGWVDIARERAAADEMEPPLTYFSHRGNSRIGLVLGNTGAVEFSADFRRLSDELCARTTSCSNSLNVSSGVQRMPKNH